MRSVIFLVVLLLSAAEAAAGPLSGHVRDVSTAAPIHGATIKVMGAGASVTSDSHGVFAVTAREDWTIEVSATGYETTTLTGHGNNSRLELWLLPNAMGQIIEVTGRVTTHPPGSTPMERDEIVHMPGSRGDALSAIKSLPGIANNGSLTPGSAGIIIRGSSPKDSKIFVDGFEIPILYHFLGLQSVFASEMIERIDYKPGGFGVEQGQASAGTISVTSREGSRTYAASTEVSFVSAAAFAQGPLGKRGSFAIAMRRSLIDTVLPLALPNDSSLSFTALPRYYDFQARFDWKPKDDWNLSLLVFGTDDGVQMLNESENPDDPEATGRFVNDTSFIRAIASAAYERGAIKTRLSISGFVRNNRFEIGSDRHLRLDDIGVGARSVTTVRLDDALSLVVGGEAEIVNADVDIRFPRPPREGDGQLPSFSFDPLIEFNDSVRRGNVAAWAALKYAPSKRLDLKAGARFDGFIRPGEYVVQPRGQARFSLDRRTALVGAAGLYTRPPDNQDENLQTDLKTEKAAQIVVGVERGLFKGATVQTSAFYTKRSDLIVFATNRMAVTENSAVYANLGSGRSYGAELLAKYRTDRSFAWLAYTLSRSERRDGDDPTMRPFDFDQTHNLVMVLSHVVDNARKWRIGGRFQLTSGNPFTPVLGATYRSDGNYYQPTFGAANSVRLDAQHQLDVRVDRIWKFKHWKLAAFLDISNVYVNAAVVDYSYNYDYSERQEFTTLPILPSMGVRGEF